MPAGESSDDERFPRGRVRSLDETQPLRGISPKQVTGSRRRSIRIASVADEAKSIIDELARKLNPGDRVMLQRAYWLLTGGNALAPKLERVSGETVPEEPPDKPQPSRDPSQTEDSVDEIEMWLYSQYAVQDEALLTKLRRKSMPDGAASEGLRAAQLAAFQATMKRSDSLSSNGSMLARRNSCDSSGSASIHEQQQKGLAVQFAVALVLSNSSQQQLTQLFDTVDDWDFDVFALNDLTNGRPLFALMYMLFLKHDLMKKFRVKERHLRNFLKHAEATYGDHPFHNRIHAAAVVHATYYFFRRCRSYEALGELAFFAALIAAACHDLGHPGTNNAYQSKTLSEYALLYNDRAVLENHHCSQLFRLASQEESNIFRGLREEEFKEVRAIIISMILGTDMAQHFELVGNFRNKVGAPGGMDLAKADDRTILLQITLKCADICNAMKEPGSARKWSELIMEEFYQQGDKERAQQLPISAFCDRTKQSVAQCQFGFLDYICKNLFFALAEFLQEQDFLKHYSTNRDYWAGILAEEEAAKNAAAAAGRAALTSPREPGAAPAPAPAPASAPAPSPAPAPAPAHAAPALAPAPTASAASPQAPLPAAAGTCA
eukprot:tig00000802_g4280.t1